MFKRKSRSGDGYRSDRPGSLGPWLIRILILLLIAAVTVSVLFATGVITTVSSKITAFGLKDIGELATQAGYFTGVQSIEKKKEFLGITLPFSQSSYVFSYDGVVKAGLNFGDIGIELNEKDHIIHITLPEIKILSVEIDPDSFKEYSSSGSFITPLQVSDVNLSLSKLKEKVLESAIANGIKENAMDNAKLMIRGFLAGCYDLSIYRIEFEETENNGL